MYELAPSFQALLATFASAFTSPTYLNFELLVSGWVLAQGRHTVSEAIRRSGAANWGHFARLYRFLSRARWEPDQLGFILFRLLVRFLDEDIIVAPLDDTVSHRSGPHIWGAGMHYDAGASSYGKGSSRGRQRCSAFGLDFVVLSVWVPYPWDRTRGAAIPVLGRLYRGRSRCPEDEYRKRTELARELIEIFESWVCRLRLPHLVFVAGDQDYSCGAVAAGLPDGIGYIGSLRMNAALYALPPKPEATRRRGRPRKKGERLPNPRQMAEDPTTPWTETKVSIYGRQVTVLTKSVVALWYSAMGTSPVLVVVTRDPRGRIEDRAYFCTLPDTSVETAITVFARRWSLEVTFRDCKQLLGLEDPANGWGLLEGRERPKRKSPGPQPRGRRGENAVRRTTPFILLVYGLIHVWYFTHGTPDEDVSLARWLSPWYRSKTAPSFQDMLRSLRAEIIRHRISQEALPDGKPENSGAPWLQNGASEVLVMALTP